MLDSSSQGGLKKREEKVIVTVTNLDNTVTTYAYEPAPGRLVALEDFYRDHPTMAPSRGSLSVTVVDC